MLGLKALYKTLRLNLPIRPYYGRCITCYGLTRRNIYLLMLLLLLKLGR